MPARPAAAVLQDCLERLDGIRDLSQAPALLRVVEDALGVRPPPGRPDTIREVAATVRRAGRDWDGVTGDLTTVAGRGLPAAWSGTSADRAQAQVGRLATVMAELPPAFATVSRSLEDWANVVENAQRDDADQRPRLQRAADGLNRMGAGGHRTAHLDAERAPLIGGAFGNADREAQQVSAHLAVAVDAISVLSASATHLRTQARVVARTLTSVTATSATSADSALRSLGAPLPIDPAATRAGDAAAQEARTITDGDGTSWGPDQTAALARLDALLRTYEGNTSFQIALMNSLGPTELLALSSTLARMGAPIPAHDGVNASLARPNPLAPEVDAAQHGLAAALAAATAVPGRVDATWLAELENDGKKAIPSGAGRVYGYQTLSVLLGRRGVTYPTDFLTAVGTDLLAWERTPRHLAPEDSHLDAEGGLMTALGANKAAATAFFDRNGDALSYLAGRDWARSQDQAAFAHAVDRAVSDPSDPVDQAVMQKYTHVLGTELRGRIPDAMQPEVAHSMRAYIRSGAVDQSFYATSGATQLNAGDVRRILVTLGHDPGQYVDLTSAEIESATRSLAVAPGDEYARAVSESSAQSLGALAHGQANGIYDTYAADDAHHNRIVNGLFAVANKALGYAPVGDITAEGLSRISEQLQNGSMQDSSGVAHLHSITATDDAEAIVKQWVAEAARRNPHLSPGAPDSLSVDAGRTFHDTYDSGDR